MTTPKYVRVLFVGGPLDGQTREVEYRERYVVDVWTGTDVLAALVTGYRKKS